MGRPKLLLPWRHQSILGHLVETWRTLDAEEIAIVHAPDDRGILAELDRLAFPGAARIPNPLPDLGMFSSIQCAARWEGWSVALTHWAIVLGDQPHVGLATLRDISQFSAAHPQQICLPRQGGHRRHPVVLPRDIFLELRNSTATDLKAFLDQHAATVAIFESADPALGLDIDTPQDYDKVKDLFLTRNRKSD